MNDFIENVAIVEQWRLTCDVADMFQSLANQLGIGLGPERPNGFWSDPVPYGRSYRCYRENCNGMDTLEVDRHTHNQYHDNPEMFSSSYSCRDNFYDDFNYDDYYDN